MAVEPAIEVELKYRATPRAMARLAKLDRLGEASLGPARRIEQRDRYLDTPDGRLAATRWACRLRRRDRRTFVTLKGPAAGSTGALHRRPEVEGPATESLDPATWPPSAARTLLADLSGVLVPLVERVALRQTRIERAVTLRGGEVGTLSLDEAFVVWQGRELVTLRDVELELSAGGEPLAGQLARFLGLVAGLEPEPTSKLERALAAVEAVSRPGAR